MAHCSVHAYAIRFHSVWGNSMFWGFQTLLCQQLICPSHLAIARLMSVTVLSLQTRLCFLSVTSLSLHELEPQCLSHCYCYSVLSLRDRRYVTIATVVRKFVTENLKWAISWPCRHGNYMPTVVRGSQIIHVRNAYQAFVCDMTFHTELYLVETEPNNCVSRTVSKQNMSDIWNQMRHTIPYTQWRAIGSLLWTKFCTVITFNNAVSCAELNRQYQWWNTCKQSDSIWSSHART